MSRSVMDMQIRDVHAPVYAEREEGVLQKLEVQLEGLSQLERLNELVYAQAVIAHEVADLMGVELEV